MLTPDEIVKLLDLKPLQPEGGFFRETWRSSESIAAPGLPARYAGPRSFGTAIYYLLTPETFSALHRLPTDEVFHFYLGDPVLMLQLHPDGHSEEVIIGPDITSGQQLQVIVPAGTWQGMYVKPRVMNAERETPSSSFMAQRSSCRCGPFALLGTTMSPGYDAADYEAADPQRLIQVYPDRLDLILRLTRPR